MLEYWKNEAKANEEKLTTSNEKNRRNAKIEKLFNTLKAIHTKNLMKHFMRLRSDPVAKNQEEITRRRSFKINGSARKSIQNNASLESSPEKNRPT